MWEATASFSTPGSDPEHKSCLKEARESDNQEKTATGEEVSLKFLNKFKTLLFFDPNLSTRICFSTLAVDCLPTLDERANVQDSSCANVQEYEILYLGRGSQSKASAPR